MSTSYGQSGSMIVVGLILIGLAAVMAMADSGQLRAHADPGAPTCPRLRSARGRVALVAGGLLN